MARFITPHRHGERGDLNRLVNVEHVVDVEVDVDRRAGVPEGTFIIKGYLPGNYVDPGAGNSVVLGEGYPDLDTAQKALVTIRTRANGPTP